jgi:phosphate starvation-inducible PhoH-like protein
MSRRSNSNNKSPVGQAIDQVERQTKERRPLIKPVSVTFKTKKQLKYFEAIMSNKITVSSGSPGTGKTYVAVYAACQAIAAGQVEKIVITKPAVEIGKSLGALPGDVDEKMAVYIRSIEECFIAIIGDGGLANLYSRHKLEILPLNYLRGLTFKDTFLIADEMQNADFSQTKALLTRFGEGSTFVLNGDVDQSDIHGQSGLPVAIKILQPVNETSHIEFTIDDIVRDGIVKEIMISYHEYQEELKKNKE